MINLVLENAHQCEIIDSLSNKDDISISVIKHISKAGVLKVFDEQDLILVVNTSLFQNKNKIEIYSSLHNALKRYEMNLEANIFNPTVEVA